MSTHTTDPLTCLELALWFALEAHPDVGRLVKLANKVNFVQPFKDQPGKTNLQDSEVPELALMLQGGQGNQNNASSHHGIVRRYSLAVTTNSLFMSGDKERRGAGLNPVYWACCRALAMYRAGIPSLPFCRKVWVTEDQAQISDGEKHRADRAGWVGIATVSCDLFFPWDEVDA